MPCPLGFLKDWSSRVRTEDRAQLLSAHCVVVVLPILDAILLLDRDVLLRCDDSHKQQQQEARNIQHGGAIVVTLSGTLEQLE